MILAGDIGGTKTNLALHRLRDGAADPVFEKRLESRSFDGPEALLDAFLSSASDAGFAAPGYTIDRACLAVAAPVFGDRFRMPNLGWVIDGAVLRNRLGTDRLAFLNDVQATARGIDSLPAAKLHTLHEGRPDGPTRGVLAPGTGLGGAILTRIDGRCHVLPSEAGHLPFAPVDEEEEALLAWLRGRHGRVSTERVVSGPGLVTVYEFLLASGRHETSPAVVDRLAAAVDKAAAISELALDGDDPLCVAALDRWVRALGAVAGAFALSVLALGGVYVGGGIPPRIVSALEHDGFLTAFRSQGRVADLLREVPVRVILEPRTAMLGAARHAVASWPV